MSVSVSISNKERNVNEVVDVAAVGSSSVETQREGRLSKEHSPLSINRQLDQVTARETFLVVPCVPPGGLCVCLCACICTRVCMSVCVCMLVRLFSSEPKLWSCQ